MCKYAKIIYSYDPFVTFVYILHIDSLVITLNILWLVIVEIQ